MKLHKEGRSILLVILAILVTLNLSTAYFLSHAAAIVVATISALLYLLCVAFFREMPRPYSGERENMVIAPADGTVVAIEEVMEYEFFGDKRMQVSIFMSVFNQHMNWYPTEGVVIHSSHKGGRTMSAYLPKSSTENERSTVAVQTPKGAVVMFRQVAGAVAKRIVTYAKEGDRSELNKQMGFIKFGSRVDLYLPLDSQILVKMGEKTHGNQTPIAKLK